jgi:hypothetical protein
MSTLITWKQFLSQNKGKGKSMTELGRMYCQKKVSEKIAINMKEGKYKSKNQAIAVAYSQVRKISPACDRFLKRKNK